MSKPPKTPKKTASPTSNKKVGPQPLQYRARQPPLKSPIPTPSAPIPPAFSRARKIPLILAGITLFGISCYSTLIYINLSRDDPRLKRIPRDASDRFDDNAWIYDKSVDTVEWLTGIHRRRKQMASMARGHLLEVAAGTGRNHVYYDTKKLDTVTMLDQSAQMLAVAKKKWKDEHPEYAKRIFWRTQSALEPIAPPAESPDGFDVVIQTMGLCSTAEPVKLLQNLGEAAKEDGRILLLEHGKSHYAWLNGKLDATAAAHADEHGCWWNKDIGQIVEDSGLEVVELKRYNFGTTWWVELKPRRRKSIEKDAGGGNRQEKVAQRPWWAF